MVTKKDYEALLEYFETHAIPDNLTVLIEKLKLMYKSILIAEKYQEDNKEINAEISKLMEENKEV